VVGSRVGGIPEVVEDGVTGLLVTPDDPAALAMALNTVLTNASLATSMGQGGRDRAVSEFGWRTVAEQTAALYSELGSEAGGTRSSMGGGAAPPTGPERAAA